MLGSSFSITVNDIQGCNNHKPILLVFYYRLGPDTVELPKSQFHVQNCLHGNQKEVSRVKNVVSREVGKKHLTSIDHDDQPEGKLISFEGPLKDHFGAEASPLSHLVQSMDFKRRNKRGSRFVIRFSEAGAEPDRGMAQHFLSSVFQGCDAAIKWTLNPEP